MTVKSGTFAQKFRRCFWGLFAFACLFVLIIFVLIGNEFFGPMPSFEELENPKSNVASEIISEDNVSLGTYYIQNRTFVDYDEISPNVHNALVATEDIRFRQHSGTTKTPSSFRG